MVTPPVVTPPRLRGAHAVVPRALLVAALSSVVLAGCAAVLGGLDEGTARDDADASDATTDSAGDGVSAACPGWVPGFHARRRVVIENAGPDVARVQLRLPLDAAAMTARGDLRPDGADVRVARIGASDAVAPHWWETATTLWTRLDVPSGRSTTWLYSRSSDAEDTSSLEDTFVPVVDDVDFTHGGWVADRAGAPSALTPTDEWSANVGDGAASLRLVRQANDNGAVVGVCQTMLLPGTARHVFVADVDVMIADHARIAVEAGGLASFVAWSAPISAIGGFVATTEKLAPGVTTICLSVSVEGSTVGQGAQASFRRPRVRLVPDVEPVVSLADDVETCP